ncbi:sensor domain-containing diguanylate cyclase [Malonomonas rubra]|nr:sensor domain-containing diguanylate cyclase [Malonomonas rubra]
MLRTWVLGVLCVFVSSFFIGYTIQSQKNATLQEARNHAVNDIHYLGLDIDRTLYGLNQTFTGIENLLRTIDHVDANKPGLIQAALENQLAQNTPVSSLLILNTAGKALYKSNSLQQEELQYSDFFSIHTNHQLKQLYIGRPIAVTGSTDRWQFGVSRGLRNSTGELEMVLVGMVDLNLLFDRYQAIKLSNGASLTLSSLDGYVYTHLPDHQQYVGKFLRNLVRPGDLTKKTIVMRQPVGTDQQIHLIASRRIGNYPLVVSISEPEGTILASWRKTALNFAVLGTVVSLIIMFMTYRVTRYQKKQLRIKEELRNQATTDALTGLANRRSVLEHAEHEIKKARRTGAPLSFILIDLDHFKKVNDTYGHEMGDKVLQRTAKLLNKMCREADIVSRYGGEEFLLLLSNTDLDGALIDAERIRRTLAKQPHRCQNKVFNVTASIGVSQWAEHEENYIEALRRADKALYKVKNLGRNDVDYQCTATVTPLRKNHLRLQD